MDTPDKDNNRNLIKMNEPITMRADKYSSRGLETRMMTNPTPNRKPLRNPSSKDEILFHFILLRKVTTLSSAFPILPHPILNNITLISLEFYCVFKLFGFGIKFYGV